MEIRRRGLEAVSENEVGCTRVAAGVVRSDKKVWSRAASHVANADAVEAALRAA